MNETKIKNKERIKNIWKVFFLYFLYSERNDPLATFRKKHSEGSPCKHHRSSGMSCVNLKQKNKKNMVSTVL